MFILPALIGLLSLDGILALEIPSGFKSRKRQDVRGITVNLPPEAATALKNFFNNKANLYSCPENLGGPPTDIDGQLKKRQLSDIAKADYGCFYGVSKAAVAAVSENQGLRALYKYSREIVISVDQPTFQDAKTQEAFSAHLLAGAKMLETSYPGIKSDTSNKILSVIFLATHAKIITQAAYYGYFGVGKEYLRENESSDKCPEDYGVSIDCDNPLCMGNSQGECYAASIFSGCECVTFVCPDESDIPYCDDCGGVNLRGVCKGIPEEKTKYEDCRCIITRNPPPYIGGQHGFEDTGVKVGKLPYDGNNDDGTREDDPAPINPSCKGIDVGKWVARDPAIWAAENDFCKDSGRLKSQGASNDLLKSGAVNYNAWYNHNENDDMHLKITWYQNGEITYDECVGFFRSIIDGCDKPEDSPFRNPGNMKRGGKWTHQSEGSSSKVAVLELNPSGGKYRNDCTGLDSEYWVTDLELVDPIKDFCPQAYYSSNERLEKTYNDGSLGKVILVADWADDTRSLSVCEEAFRRLKDECYPQELPKRGGVSIPNGRAMFALWPQEKGYA